MCATITGMDSMTGDGDVIESPSTGASRLADRWSTLSRRGRMSVTAVSGLVVAALLLGYGAVFVNRLLAERALDDQVTLQTSLGITASSMAAGGGRVDFFASVRNSGPRPVSVTGVQISAPRLQISSQAIQPPQVAPGETVRVPLSVLLDCVASGPDRAGTGPGSADDALPGLVSAVPPSGGQRSVATTFDHARLVTAVADTLCAVKPELRGVHLDGPVR